MNTKKFVGLVLSFAGVLSLASCGENANPEEQKQAVEKVLEAGVCYNGSNYVYEGYTVDFEGDSNDALTVTVKTLTKVNGNTYTVTIDYDYDETIGKLVDIEGDDTHKKIEWTYPGPLSADDKKREEDGEDVGNIYTQVKATAKCGQQSKEATYDLKLKHITNYFDDMSIADLYKKSDDGSTFAFMKDGKIGTNHDQNFYYVSVSGKVVYKAPDSNWGILSDGEHSVQLFKLSKCNDNYKIVEGAYVKIYGEIAQYFGNIQLSFISKAEVLADHSSIKEPVDVKLSAHINDKSHADFVAFNDGLSNRVGTLEGLTVKDAVDIDAFDRQKRYTFTVEKDGQEFTIAYDYHVKTNDGKLAAAYKAAIKAAAADSSKKLNITGTIRWSSTGNGISSDGAWQLVPFLANHIVVA